MSPRFTRTWPAAGQQTTAGRPRTSRRPLAAGPAASLRRRLALNGLTTTRWSLLEDVAGCQDAGFEAIGLWRPKVHEFGEEQAAELLGDSGLCVSTLSWAGGFTGTHGHGFADALEDARDAIRLAAQVGAECLVIISGARSGHTLNHARRLLVEALKRLANDAGDLGVTLALQPMHRMFADDWTFLTRLDDTVDILALVDHPRLKLSLDVYQQWQEPDLLERLPGLVPLIATVGLSDWREPRSRHDRCLPGDGVIPLAAIVEALVRGGYRGCFDVQVWSDEHWQSDYHDLVHECHRRFTALFPALPSPVL